MDSNARIRVIIPCRGAGADIFRTLASLASQTVGPKRQNVILASSAPEEHADAEASLLRKALGFNSVEVLDASALPEAKAVNIAALDGGEQTLALAPEGARLSPRFLEACLHAMRGHHAAASFPLHTAGSQDAAPLVRLRPFSAEQLTRGNPVGPAVLVRREAWESLGGLRPGARLALWDFWLRLALSGGTGGTGGRIVRVQELLAHCPPLRRLSAREDGEAKALLVAGAPGAFDPDTCRWALALLRGEGWAKPFTPGVIPSAHEIRAMHAAALRPRGFARAFRQELRSA
ncbi:MAG: hypothetical protein HY916_04695 [Desulfovibrio sp.]|jgi:hypothetical protein|nr:hypothetical protein [Desulfovibrio sp.]